MTFLNTLASYLRKGTMGRTKSESIWSEATRHPRFDPISKRVLLTKEEIEALPVKELTVDELWEAMCDPLFNPWNPAYYPRGIEPLEYEQGYDIRYRYICKGEL